MQAPDVVSLLHVPKRNPDSVASIAGARSGVASGRGHMTSIVAMQQIIAMALAPMINHHSKRRLGAILIVSLFQPELLCPDSQSVPHNTPRIK